MASCTILCLLMMVLAILVGKHGYDCKGISPIGLSAPANKTQSSSYANSCGLCGQPISVTLIISNQFKIPFFEYQVTLKSKNQRELIYFLEAAAVMDPHFKFSADNHGSLGYFITSINGLSGSISDKTYWEILEHPSGNSLSYGVSSYVPSEGETIRFKFTTWDTQHS